MTSMENVFVCMAAPLVMVILCLGRKYRPAVFMCLAGMGMCLLSAYLNSFFAQAYAADQFNANTQIAPVVEEIMKLLPLLFYLEVFKPGEETFKTAAIIVAASFATFENVCYLMRGGEDDLPLLLIRGFGTGAMHVICGSTYSYWMRFVWQREKLRNACLLGILCLAITYHAVYNLLVSVGGTARLVAYLIPMGTVTFGWMGYIILTRCCKRGRDRRNMKGEAA